MNLIMINVYLKQVYRHLLISLKPFQSSFISFNYKKLCITCKRIECKFIYIFWTKSRLQLVEIELIEINSLNVYLYVLILMNHY